MHKLTGIIITLNEEKKIAICLESIKDVCDEIIVVDSFSTDNTKQICQNYGVKFIEHKFEGYRDQKNFAMNLSSNNYVLNLDADEIISDDLKNFILKEKQRGFKYDAYKFNRLSSIGGKAIKHGEWYPDAKIRLWNKNKGKWGGKNVHETVQMNKDSKILKVKYNILHFPYDNIFEYNKQLVNFAKIWAKDAFNAGKKTNLLSAIMHSKIRFIKGFFLKKGFLDGYTGYLLAKSAAHYTLIKYLGLLELHTKPLSKC